MSTTITRQEIYNWITTKQNFELLLEDYYKKSGKNYTIEAIYENVANKKNPQESLGYTFNTDLQSLGATYYELKESLLFSETDWIQPFMDVAIHKHPRFFPAFEHHHAFFELCYVLNGDCMQAIFTQQEKKQLTLQKGDILFIPPNIKHSISMNSDSSVVNILIRKSTFEKSFLNNLPSDTFIHTFFVNALYSKEENAKYILCHTGDDKLLIEHFLNIAEEYCNHYIYSNNIINQELSIFFCTLLRNHSDSMEFSDESSAALDIIPSILQYIEINYAQISIQDIAAHFGFNASYIGRTFKASTNQTLIDALVGVRISKAKNLLTTTNQPVEIISEMVGYNDTTYFIRAFKKQTGFTPLQYRKHTKTNL